MQKIELGKKPILKVLWGSRHFGLHNNDSDYDFNVFTAPTIDDLIRGNRFSHFNQYEQDNGRIMDVSARDIVTFSRHLNEINFANMLFAVSEHDNSPEIQELLSIRNEIAIMDLPNMYRHTIKKAKIDICSSYPKDWYHGVRMHDALIRFEESGWDMNYAMTYTDADMDEIMEVKTKRDHNLAYKVFKEKNNKAMGLHQKYNAVAPNIETQKHVEDIIRRLVRRYIKDELNAPPETRTVGVESEALYRIRN